jgi:AraC-like DNA-binding protein
MARAPRVLVNPPGSRLGDCNAIVSGVIAAREPDSHVVSDFVGPLSIKYMIAGTGFWETPDGCHRVEGEAWLVLNEGQSYSLDMQGGELRESFCPMFARGFLADVARARSAPAEALLDSPDAGDAPALRFFEHLRRGEPAIPRQLRRMRDRFRASAPPDGAILAFLDEELHVLATLLLDAACGDAVQVDHVPAARASTRAELFRRVHCARDYLHAHAAEPVALAEIARAACLSPHHLLRVFARVFGVTPHRYLQRLRIARACGLLRDPRRSVTDVCLEVGFESLGSFSTLFRREVGLSPSAFRAAAASNFARSEKPARLPAA